jgi:Leucine-rich repeat (LRR) protein
MYLGAISGDSFTKPQSGTQSHSLLGFRDISEDMFCSLPTLSQLYLADNQLSDINFDLSCLKNLRHVDLQGNKIKTLDKVGFCNVFKKPKCCRF